MKCEWVGARGVAVFFFVSALPFVLAATVAMSSCATGGGAEPEEPPSVSVGATGGKDQGRDGEGAHVPPATETVRRGEALLAKGKLEKARERFEKALDNDPEDVRAQFDLALVLEKQGHEDRAVGAYRRTLELDPAFPQALNNLALLLRDRGRTSEAVDLLKRAIESRADYADAHANLGLALRDRGELEKAARSFRTALKHESGDAITRANLGLTVLELGRRKEAAEVFRRALSHAKGNAAALQAIGSGLRRAGDFEPAVRAMKMAIEAHGEPTPALLSELALAQNAAGHQKDAEATLGRVLELAPDYATAHYLLGSLRASRGAYEKAVSSFQRYLELAPKGPHADKARERLKKAREAQSGS